MMDTLLCLAGYLVYITFMVAMSFLVLAAAKSAFPSSEKYNLLAVLVAIVLPFMLKNVPWPSLISRFPSTLPSNVSEMLATLVGVGGYLVYIACMMGLSLLVVTMASLICGVALGMDQEEWPGWIWVIIFGVPCVVIDMVMKQSSVSNMMATLLASVSNMTATLLGLVGMIATPSLAFLALSCLVVMSFLLLMGLGAMVSKLLAPATQNYPKLMFAGMVGLIFMVMKYMLDTSVDKSSLVSESFSTLPSIFSSTRTTLLGVAAFINDCRVAYWVMRYMTVLAFFWLPLMSKSMTTCSMYTKAAVIITLGVLLTMQPPAMPMEKPALIYESQSNSASSTLVLGDFIRLSEEMRVEHKMAMEKLIEESKATIQSFFIHIILILVTSIGGMVLYIRNQYPVWIRRSNSEVKNFLLTRLSFGMLGKKRPKTTPKRR